MNHIKFKKGLQKARRLLARGWTQNAWARDANGVEIDRAVSGKATCYCLWGALLEAGVPGYVVVDANTGHDISEIQWNDAPGRTQGEVLAALDRSIAALR